MYRQPKIKFCKFQIWWWVYLCLYLSVKNIAKYAIVYPIHAHIDGLVQERRSSSALAMELHLSCTNPLIYVYG